MPNPTKPPTRLTARLRKDLRDLGNDRRAAILSWVAFVLSAVLLLWQVHALHSDRIPDHIMPLVILISGSQESIPVAFMWTLYLGLISVALFVPSACHLIIRGFLRRL